MNPLTLAAIALNLAAISLGAQKAFCEEDIPESQMTLDDRFLKLDADKDGFLSREEYLSSQWARSNPERSPTVFEWRDSDKDGKLTLEEFKRTRSD